MRSARRMIFWLGMLCVLALFVMAAVVLTLTFSASLDFAETAARMGLVLGLFSTALIGAIVAFSLVALRRVGAGR